MGYISFLILALLGKFSFEHVEETLAALDIVSFDASNYKFSIFHVFPGIFHL